MLIHLDYFIYTELKAMSSMHHLSLGKLILELLMKNVLDGLAGVFSFGSPANAAGLATK